MAVSAGTAALQVVPTLTKNFSRELATQLAGPAVKQADKAGREGGRKFGLGFSGGVRTGVGPVKGILRGFGPGLAAAFGGAAIMSAIKSVTDEAREAAVVGKITEARLKSTGGAANVTAKQISGLAERLSNLTGVDDEVIQAGENLLLTFKGVRNEAGKGNDVFTQATKLSLDLAAGMNNGVVSASGLKTANIQLGKALEDPIRGITALRRSGVSFTEQQREQIKTLVKSGDTLGAQKIILKAVQQQFGGTAAASADAGKRFGVFVGNLKEQIGARLLPAINTLLGFLVDKLPGAFSAVAAASRAVVSWFQRAGQVASRLLGPALRSIAESVMPAAKAFTDALLPGLKSLWRVVQAQVWPAVKILAAIIGVTLFAALKFVLPLILRLAGPVLGFLFKQLGQTIQWISNVVRFIGRLGAWFLRWITGTKTTGQAMQVLGQRVGAFAAAMTKQWQTVIRQVGNALGFLKRVSLTVLSFMIRLWLRWAGNIVDAAATAMGWVPGIGPKLRAAQTKFREFAAGVTRELNKIEGENVRVTARAGITWTAEAAKFRLAAGRMAEGGKVRGPAGRDKVPIWATAGEAVVPPRLVPAVAPFLASHGVPGFARGGVVPRTDTASTVRARDVQPMVTGLAKGLGSAVGKGLTKAVAESLRAAAAAGAGAAGGSGVGGTVGNAANAWRVFRSIFGLPMGGRAPRANVSDHPSGHAIDIMTGLRSLHRQIIAVGKQLPGAKYWISYRQIGSASRGWTPRYYGGPSPHTDHVHWSFYDNGGWLPPGKSVAVNRTGKPERVLGPNESLVPAGQGSITVNVTVNGAVGSPKAIALALVPEIRQGLKEAQRRAGVPAREQVR